jgi:hypothetical protein
VDIDSEHEAAVWLAVLTPCEELALPSEGFEEVEEIEEVVEVGGGTDGELSITNPIVPITMTTTMTTTMKMVPIPFFRGVMAF